MWNSLINTYLVLFIELSEYKVIVIEAPGLDLNNKMKMWKKIET